MVISLGSNTEGCLLSCKSLGLALPLSPDIFQFHAVQEILVNGLVLCQVQRKQAGNTERCDKAPVLGAY